LESKWILTAPPQPHEDSDNSIDFQSQLFRYSHRDGSAFEKIMGNPLIRSFGRRDSDMILLSHVRSGTLTVRHNGDKITVLDSSDGLVMLDCDRPVVTSSTRYDMTHLALPRRLVTEALGKRGAFSNKAVVKLPAGGLTPILVAQLDVLTEHGPRLSAIDSDTAMQVATSLALILLSRLPLSKDRDSETHDDALFITAMRYIELNAWRHDLTSDRIALAAKCSRAHLYRVFAHQGRDVIGTLREIRLTRARAMLVDDSLQSIGVIAFNNGYSDPSAFGKAFRRRFGLTPAEVRSQIAAAAMPLGSSSVTDQSMS
jgi:AraC-like DNA-binding protein